MTPEDLIRAYESALATQSWANVEPLLHPGVCVTFSDGRHFRGRDAVRAAFEANFAAIQDERYELADLHWVARGPDFAACTYRFVWSGLIGGRPAQGSGRGTSVLKREDGAWLVLAEQLGPAA